MGVCSSSDAAVSQPTAPSSNTTSAGVTTATTKGLISGTSTNDGISNNSTIRPSNIEGAPKQPGPKTTPNDEIGYVPGVPQDENGKVRDVLKNYNSGLHYNRPRVFGARQDDRKESFPSLLSCHETYSNGKTQTLPRVQRKYSVADSRGIHTLKLRRRNLSRKFLVFMLCSSHVK
jgi:hypothetical protein